MSRPTQWRTQTAKALAAFDKYQSDKLVSAAAALAKIIEANPQAFKALQAGDKQRGK